MPRISNRCVGEMLTNDSNIDSASLKERSTLKNLLLPFGIEYIATKERIAHFFNQFFNTILTKSELPVTHHAVRL